MRQDEGDRPRVETVIQRVEDCTCHRHAVMRFEQRGNVRREDRNGIAALYPAPAQRVRELAAALVKPGVGEPSGIVDDRNLVGIDLG